AVTVGIVSGIGINAAHELGHKREDLEHWASKLALAPSWYGHFFVEHNWGHHKRVATPEDPASSRLGESFYRFWPRTVFGSLRSAWQIERRRLERKGRSVLSPANRVLQAWSFSVVLWAVALGLGGPQVLLFLVVQAVVGLTLLEAVNYVEHYGLLRQRDEHGRYERVRPVHSWNNNHVVTNLLLYQLQRHSDHHENPARRFVALRHVDEAPQLPAGYAAMILLALVPPLWRRTMDHRVLAHYDGNAELANRRSAARLAAR
ncbi:MAG: alkane 1-monooxygenase, partial [Phycicoccus sp.]